MLTADSMSDKEGIERESHVESTTTKNTCRKRQRTIGNTGMHAVRYTNMVRTNYATTVTIVSNLLL